MKNNPLHKINWEKKGIFFIRFMIYLMSIILTPFTIIIWLFDNNGFKEDWNNAGYLIICFFIIDYVNNSIESKK